MRDVFQPAVYILASHKNGTLYTGVTSDLLTRVWKHRADYHRGFTRTYGVKRLLWFEQHETMEAAIRREKQIKIWLRAWKVRLIEEANPGWRDLALDLGLEPEVSTRVVSSPDGLPPSRE
uniref:GIY-YIG nuclease family protein n=1 Tax=uncultured Sphingomonas sp. TaxID=158754 RepID=UPI0025F4401B|nr:GIY-YIG nuclease family protein [uncultured Sphingomonas sp.]